MQVWKELISKDKKINKKKYPHLSTESGQLLSVSNPILVAVI